VRTSGIVVASLLALTAGGWPAAAQEIVKARQGEMEQLGKRMTAIKEIVVDGKGGTLAEVAAHAEYVQGKLPSVPSWFPPGSDRGPDETWALPKIWQDFAGFEAAARNAQALAGRLLVAARAGDRAATVQAFAALGKDGCGGCHTPFRRPQE
jgi:cytochrome c556